MGAPLPVLDMVLVGEEWRAVGIVSAEQLEELERMHDAGDLRAEARLKLLREGRAECPRLFLVERVFRPR